MLVLSIKTQQTTFSTTNYIVSLREIKENLHFAQNTEYSTRSVAPAAAECCLQVSTVTFVCCCYGNFRVSCQLLVNVVIVNLS